MSDQQDIWTSIREKLDWEEVNYLNSVMDKQNKALKETGRNLEELQRLLGQLKESTLDVATDQFSQEIEAHEREQAAPAYDPDGELERVELKIIAGDSVAVAYTNDSVKRFIEKRLLLAWTALKSTEHLEDEAPADVLGRQDVLASPLDIIGICVEEMQGLDRALSYEKSVVI